jgi:HK97 family phage major capsid protein
MKNITEIINSLNQNSTVEDFKRVLLEREKAHDEQFTEHKGMTDGEMTKLKDENKALGTQLQKLIEASVKWGKEGGKAEPDYTRMIRAAKRGDIVGVYEQGGLKLKGRNIAEWSEPIFNFGTDIGTIKAALGSYELVGDAVTGSYLVPTGFYNEVQRIARQESVMLSKIRTIPMNVRSIRVPTELTAADLTWVTDETHEKTESAPTFHYVTLLAYTLAGWCSATDELIEDSSINLAEYFRNLYAEAYGVQCDTQILNSNANPFTSILYNSSCNAVQMGPGRTGFANIKFSDLLDMENAISLAKGENALNGAVWIMHRKIFNYLRALKDDNGMPIYQGPAEGTPAMIYSRPYILSDVMPSTSAVSTGFLILGNPRYWLHGERVGMSFDIFDRTFYRMQFDQTFFRFRVRAGFVGGTPAGFAVLKTAAS